MSCARLLPVIVALICTLTACSESDPEDSPEGALRVLFVGNSLTYTNDLPGVVEAFGRANDEPVTVESVAYPNYALEDHWAQGEAREALASGAWDFVVMQQGPSSLPENQEHLRVWTERFAAEARRYGVTPALYQVWPSAAYASSFPAVIESYESAAAAAEAILLPAGEAWLEAWARRPALALYGSDGFHPSETGTYLAALVVYGGLTQAPLNGLPHDLRTDGGAAIDLRISDARWLQRVATDVLARHD